MQGSKKKSPTVGKKILQQAIKWFHLLRYMHSTIQKLLEYYPTTYKFDDIIEHISPLLEKTILKSHSPSHGCKCNTNTFIMDGTMKIMFRVCAFQGC